MTDTMTAEERLARQCVEDWLDQPTKVGVQGHVAKFIREAIAQEREACELILLDMRDSSGWPVRRDALDAAATAIRARGEKQ